MPQHGEERGPHRRETTYGPARTLRTAAGPAVTMPLFSSTISVSERYCAWCGAWMQARGLMGAFGCVDCKHLWDDAPVEAR